MDFDDLRLFLHLSRTLHFGRTSRECHLSASALSRAIQRLEQSVGQPLFDRDNRSVELTRAGARFVRFAAETLAEWERVSSDLAAPNERLRGRIAIFATVTACQSFLPELLSRFRQAHPDIHLRLETGYAADALAMLENNSVDVTVAALPPKIPKSLVTRVVTHTPLIFIAPTRPCDVSRRVDDDPIDWPQLPLVLPAFGLARQAVDRWARARAIELAIYSEVTGNEAILSLVSTGCGVGVVPSLVMEQSPLRGHVRAIEGEAPLGEFRIGVCCRRKSLDNPLVAAFWESTATAAREGEARAKSQRATAG
jgi:LysR family transcriptional regulator, positive regulator for ilvC